MPNLHRNSQKRIHRAEEIYFVTSKTKNNFPFFEEQIFCELWLEELKLAKRLKKFELFAFALNPDHFHLVVKPNFGVANISEVMKFLKKNFSINANRTLGRNNYSVTTSEGDDVFRRRTDLHDGKNHHDPSHEKNCGDQSGAEKHPRLRSSNNWQSDFDQTIVLPLCDQFLTKHGHDQNKFPIFAWQRSFHDHIIRNPADFTHHIGYATWNHLKHGLPENWKYTSLNFPELIDSLDHSML